MHKLGILAAIATIVAAVYTVAGYYRAQPTVDQKWDSLLEDVDGDSSNSKQIKEIQTNEKENLTAIRQVSLDEVREFHGIANQISYLPTRNKELSKLTAVALKNNHIEYAITIASDIDYLPSRDKALKAIILFSLQASERQYALKSAELMSFTTNKNEALQLLLEHESK